MVRKMYQYLVKVNDIKSLFNRIRYISQPPGPKAWAKAKIVNIVSRLNLGRIKSNNGEILISASDGDTIKKANFNIKLELVNRDKCIDTTDYWWNNI